MYAVGAAVAILGVGKSLLASFGTTKRFLDSLDLTPYLGGAAAEPILNWLGLIAFLVLSALVYFVSLKAKPEGGE